MSNAEIKEFIELYMRGVKAEITAGNYMHELQFNEINKHLEKSNGRLLENELAIERVKQGVDLVLWSKKNIFKAVGLIISFAAVLYVLFEIFGVEIILKLKTLIGII